MEKQIDKLIKKYSIELANLRENRARELNKLNDAELNDYDNQIKLTAQIIKDLNNLKDAGN